MSIKFIGAAIVAAAVATSPAMAQVTSPSSSGMAGDGQGMQQNSTMSGNMSGMATMSKSQMATMRRCQAMSSDMMMKNKRCAAMAKMHPEMMQGGSTTGG